MRALKIIAALIVCAYLCALGALYFAQRGLVFAADKTRVAPADAGFAEASVMPVTTADDERLVAWHVAPARGKKLALYFHGNAGSLADRAAFFRDLSADGTGILAIDYRGFGGSSGSPSEAGLYLDADAAYDKARSLGYSPREILVIGASLGTGVAVNLAARREIAGLVLDSPFTSALDVASARYWMFPAALLMKDVFHSDEVIKNVRAPLLMFHGTRDRTVPIRFGEALYALARRPKEFSRVDGAGHLVLRLPESLVKLREWVGALDQSAER